jgi:hypothetical protein
MNRLLSLSLAFALGLSPAAALADIDWNAHEEDDTVAVVSHDSDGAPRERTIWLLVLDGQPYIRTGSTTTWGENVLRDPNISLRVGSQEIALRAERVTDAALLARITDAFRAKYGFGDTLASLLRGDPIVFRVTPR